MAPPRITPTRATSGLLYLVLGVLAVAEQFGRLTNDTKTPLIESPGAFLGSSVGLWTADTSLGEIQNQAYGYLFPQGPFFLLGDLAGVPPWLTERLWSVLVLALALEGARLVARQLGLGPWAAWVAGLAYALTPRMLSQVATRSAELLPGAVMPWVLLPIVLALTGRLAPRRAALLSAAASIFSGGVNGTATGAPLLLVLVVLLWGVRTERGSWSLLGWWTLFTTLANAWWVVSLLRLNAYSPPFFDYVEDARTTTSVTGFAASVRGAVNWVAYIYTGDSATWPAGQAFGFAAGLVLVSGVVGALGAWGLTRWDSPWRVPFAVSAAVGLFCLTVAHASAVQGPLSDPIRALLDGPFALLRNVSKVEPVLRLPLAIGVGLTFATAVERWRPRLPGRVSWLAPAVVVGLVLALAQPAAAFNLRTPGWDRTPDYWAQTADYLAEAPGDYRAWVVPGTGFGVQRWGWTIDEPIASVARSPWLTRSQVPLVPPQTIRMLSRLESFLDTGAGSPNLARALGRLGIGHVVVRHDLDRSLAEATSSDLVSLALARSPGLERAATFGALEFGPAIEVYDVTGAPVAGAFSVSDEAEVATVGGESSDVLEAVGLGVVDPRRLAVVQGDDGWDRPADVIGDNYRARERDFGRVHDAEGSVRSPDEPPHTKRLVTNYPGNEASRLVEADYDGVDFVDASSSQGFVDAPGAVLPETSPFAAVDGDPDTAWRPRYFGDPVGEWLEVRLERRRSVGFFALDSATSLPQVDAVRAWRVTAGDRQVDVEVDPFTGRAEGDLDGVVTDRVRFQVLRTEEKDSFRLGPVALTEIDMVGLPAERSLVVPDYDAEADVDFAFTARPETRACVPTLLAPDCRQQRRRAAEESTGIDRTITVPEGGRWTVQGTVLARSSPSTQVLIDPLGDRMRVTSSSTLAGDPTVAARMSYDGNPSTAWIADPADPSPTLTVTFDRPRTVDTIYFQPPPPSAVVPTSVVITAGGETRRVRPGELNRFEPLRARRLTLRLANPYAGLKPLGMAELVLQPGGTTVPLDGAAPTGSVCGFGPIVEIDGRRYRTAADGLVGDVIAAGPLGFRTCGRDAGPVEIDAGRHRVRILATDQFQPLVVLLQRGRSEEPGPGRDLRVLSDTDTRSELDLGAGEASVLATTRNFNRGWVARLDGEELAPQRVDGWAQGWRVPEGQAGRVVITFAPERPYVVSLVVGLVVAGLLLLTALVLASRTRLAPGRPIRRSARPTGGRSARAARVARRVPAPVWLVAGLALGWVLGGLPGLVGWGVAWSLRRRPSGAGVLGLAALLAAAVVAAVQVRGDEARSLLAADVLAGIGVTTCLAIALLTARGPDRPSAP